MLSNLKVCAVIVTYNRLSTLKKCVEFVYRQSYPCHLIVIDNASEDGTDDWCRLKQANDPEFFYYERLPENQGGAGGFNRGMKLAVKNGFDYLWLMDDDCYPEETALESLMAWTKEPGGKFGWLSSVCLWTDCSLCKMNVQRKTPFRDLHEFNESGTEAQMASFVSLLVPKDIVIRYGLPIKEFFIWGDDWEYTRRISRKEKCFVIGSSRVIHAMKDNTVVSIAEDTEERLPRYEYAYCNDVFIYRREGLKGWIWLVSKYLWHSLKTLIAGHPERIKIIWCGFFTGLHFHPILESVQVSGV